MAESEGNQGKGHYPVMSSYSEKLHSIGQYVQEGSSIMYETFTIVDSNTSFITLKSESVADRFDYLDQFNLDEANTISQNAIIVTHGVVLPVLSIHIREINEYEIG